MTALLGSTLALTNPRAVTIYWYVVRGSGFVLYLLLTLSITLGLLMALRWRSDNWPRIITEELHRYILLVAAVFLVIHIGSTLLDSFIRFSVSEVLVPFTSSYRVVWMSAGIVSMYLATALFLSFYLRRFIGYKAWRTMHYAGSGAWLLALIHSVTTGTDTKSAWASIIYGGSALTVAFLLAVRFGGLPVGLGPRSASNAQKVPAATPLRPRVLWTIAGVLLLGTFLVTSGPLAPGWAARAGGAPGYPGAAAQSLSLPPTTFSDTLTGTSDRQTPGSLQPGTVLLHLKMHGSGSYPITLSYGLLLVPVDGGAQFVRGVFAGIPSGSRSNTQGAPAWSCSGSVTFQAPNLLASICTPPGAGTNRVSLQLSTRFSLDASGNVTGQLQASPATGAGAPSPGGSSN